MANTSGTPDRIRFEYKFDKLYNPTYINGAWGGLSPQGELCIHFYLERPPLPLDQTHSITEAGAVGPIISPATAGPDGEPLFIRYVSTGIVMNINTARQIVNFLQKQIAAYELSTTSADKKEAH